MSWLLVAFVPALLMLATFGLSRIESGLSRDTVTATDVAQFLEQAEAVDVRTLARAGMPEALDDMHRRRAERITEGASAKAGAKHQADSVHRAAFTAAASQSGVPTGRHKHSRGNPQFTATRRINRV